MCASGTAHQFKSGGDEKGVPENFLRPRPLERLKTLLLENTCLITLKIDKISLRVIKH